MRRIIVFALVGVSASVVHFLVASALFAIQEMSIFAANVFGFLVAFTVSYFGHYHLTFRSDQAHRIAAGRFVVTALTGFAINNICLALLTWAIGYESRLSLAAAILVAAATVYVLSGRWAFASRRQ